MELLVIACRYRDIDKGYIIEKGDDVHAWMPSFRPHPLAAAPSIASVTLKVDIGTVGYHAGRFHNGHRYIVDPIRAFMKHLTRLQDQNVSVDELYSSYISRATDYDDAELEFLYVATPAMYDFFEPAQCRSIVDFMLSIRDKHKFVHSQTPDPFSVVLNPVRGCLMECVKRLCPDRPRSFYRQFALCCPSDASHLLKSLGIKHKLVDDLPGPLQLSPGVIYISKKHCVLRIL